MFGMPISFTVGSREVSKYSAALPCEAELPEIHQRRGGRGRQERKGRNGRTRRKERRGRREENTDTAVMYQVPNFTNALHSTNICEGIKTNSINWGEDEF